MNLLRTARTYATKENAEKRLLAVFGGDLTGVRYLIAVASDGRFAPVLVGIQYVPYAVNRDITVVS